MPAPRITVTATFDHIDVAFDSAINASTFTTADVSITGPVGSNPVNLTGGSQLDATDFRVTFDPLTTRGTYTVTIGPKIADLAGHLMDQNQNGTAGEASDQFTTTLVYANANAVFTRDDDQRNEHELRRQRPADRRRDRDN